MYPQRLPKNGGLLEVLSRVSIQGEECSERSGDNSGFLPFPWFLPRVYRWQHLCLHKLTGIHAKIPNGKRNHEKSQTVNDAQPPSQAPARANLDLLISRIQTHHLGRTNDGPAINASPISVQFTLSGHEAGADRARAGSGTGPGEAGALSHHGSVAHEAPPPASPGHGASQASRGVTARHMVTGARRR